MIALGDARHLPLAADSVHCCVTSPPYWGLRDYGTANQLGLEPTPDEYVANMVTAFREVWRVLRPEGTLWLNLGDSYATGGKGGGGNFMEMRKKGAWKLRSKASGWRAAPPGLKHKDLVGIPWRVAFALQADGWYLRSDIIWAKPNPMPESVTDRPTKSHEHLFLLAKSPRYYFDQDAVREPARDWGTRDRTNWKARDPAHNTSAPHTGGEKGNFAESGRNIRDVWIVATQPFPGAHFAVMPSKLVEPCIKAGCPEGGTVLDPFAGAGTVGLVADRLRRRFVGVELSPEFSRMAHERITGDCPLFSGHFMDAISP